MSSALRSKPLREPAARSSRMAVVGAPARPREAAMESVRDRRVVGYLEHVALPRWGVVRIAAKLDTGADTSALHVESLELVGATGVLFTVLAEAASGSVRHVIRARIARRGWVRSSNGATEERFFVRTPLRLAGRSRTVELGLVDRSHMQQRMLLGRSALEGAYLVDPAHSYLVEP